MSQFLSFSRLLQRPTQHALRGQIRLGSGSLGGEQQTRRETLFFDPQMQQLLLRLQGRDHTKVFRTRKLEVNPDRPVYQFMTQQELEEAQQEVEEKMTKKLQMPPVMDERDAASKVLEEDAMLQGHDTCKYVFTDITFGVPDRQRLVSVREQEGSLRSATWEERDRILHTYFPKPGRRHYDPAMFEPENLARILCPEKYEYVLDRNCLQYEPDHPIHIRTLSLVHSHVSESGSFDTLIATRHYGPMVFNLCWNKQQDELLVHLVVNDRVEEAVDVIAVYLQIHPNCKLASASGLKMMSGENLLRRFCEIEALKTGKISMAVAKLVEERAQKQRLRQSHGAK